jgi:phage tail-like protein
MSISRPLLGAAEEAQSVGDQMTLAMNHRFAVMIDNVLYHFGDWARVTGLSVSWQQIEHRVGSKGNHAWLFPGTTRYEPITLSRSAGPGSRLVQRWLAQTSKRQQPQSGVIQLLGFAGVPLVSWRLSEFFPIAWSIDSFDAAGAKPAVETLKLVHTGFLDDDVDLEKASQL